MIGRDQQLSVQVLIPGRCKYRPDACVRGTLAWRRDVTADRRRRDGSGMISNWATRLVVHCSEC